MKHYLDLIPISARLHRKQTRMTRLCIVLSVFLITVIFSMADMEMQTQMVQAVKSYGKWHAGFVADEEQGALIAARPEVENIARYGVVNWGLEDGYQIEGIETCICGLDGNLLELFPDVAITEGSFAVKEDEAVLNETIKSRLNVGVGDTITLSTPQGSMKEYRITGITKDTALEAEHDAFGMLITIEGFDALHTKDTDASQEIIYYVAFRPYCSIPGTIRDITEQLGMKPEEVRQNTKVLALMFQSRDPYMMQFYFVAAVLAVITLAFPREGYTRPQWALRLEAGFQEGADSLGALLKEWDGPFGVSTTYVGSAEEADLTKAGPLRYTGRTVLRVDTDYEGRLYLRGTSLAVYEGGVWSGLPEGVYQDYLDRLEEEPPFPLTLPTLLGDPGAEHTAAIENLGAVGSCAYAPYFPLEQDWREGGMLPVEDAYLARLQGQRAFTVAFRDCSMTKPR